MRKNSQSTTSLVYRRTTLALNDSRQVAISLAHPGRGLLGSDDPLPALLPSLHKTANYYAKLPNTILFSYRLHRCSISPAYGGLVPDLGLCPWTPMEDIHPQTPVLPNSGSVPFSEQALGIQELENSRPIQSIAVPGPLKNYASFVGAHRQMRSFSSNVICCSGR